MTVADRDRILQAAGVDETKRVELATKVVRVLNDAMDATKVERSSFQGVFMDERVDLDHQTRLRAGEQTRDLLGLDPPKQAFVADGAGAPIILVLADFAQPRQVEVREIITVKPVGDGTVDDSPALPDASPGAQVFDVVDGEIIEPGLERDPTPTPQKRGDAGRGGPK